MIPRGLLITATAFLAGVPLVAACRAIANRTGFVARPNPIVPSHRAPVAYLGGVGLAAAAVVSGGVWRVDSARAALLPALAFLALGVLDDRRAFSAPVKFALQVVAAGGAVAAGACAPWTGLPALDAALSAFVILTLVNAFNFVDVCDGLLASLAIVYFAFVAIAAPGAREFAALGIGATAAVLLANRPPATIYLGDAGSHLLGFLAAWACLAPGGRELGVIRHAWALAVPLAELGFITAVRISKGLPWWKGSPDHFALRLQAMGWSAARVDCAACSLAAAFAAVGLVWPQLTSLVRVSACAVGAAALAGIAAWLLVRTPRAPRVSAP